MASKNFDKTTGKSAARSSPTVSGKFVAPAGKQRKHVLINQPRLKKAQELLGAKTESETIERALERVIADAQTNQDAWAAHTDFINGLIDENHEIVDVFGRLER